MGYSETLESIIKNSKLTLREISDICKENYNVKVDPSYISKLQKKKQDPASDTVNIALAKACGANPDTLLFEAYMEKAPVLIKTFFDNFIKYTRNVMKFFIRANNPKKLADMINREVANLSSFDILVEFNKSKLWKEYSVNRQMLREAKKDKEFLRVLEEYKGMPMPDNSMAPVIPEGAILNLENPKDISSGNIIIAKLPNEDRIVIRRYVPVGDNIVLIAENKNFEPVTFEKDTLTIICKVNSITLEI